VEKAGKTSWLLGTCHIGVPLDYALPAPHGAALSSARIVYTEVDLAVQDPMQYIALVSEDGPGLSTRLSPEDWRAVAWRLRQIPAPVLEHAPPWMIVSMIAAAPPAAQAQPQAPATAHPPARHSGKAAADAAKTAPAIPAAMDSEVVSRAKARGIPVAYVETLDQQVAMLGARNDAFLASLRVTHGSGAGDGGPMSALCYRGDTSVRLQILDSANPLNGPMVTDRNRAWLPRIEPDLEQGGAFVAVGALHMLGDEGLVSLLRRDGFVVTQLTTERPIHVGALGSIGTAIAAAPAPSPHSDEFAAVTGPPLALALCAPDQIVPTCFEPNVATCTARVQSDYALCVRQRPDLLPADGSFPPDDAYRSLAACAPMGIIVESIARGHLGDAPVCTQLIDGMRGAMRAALPR
jgi:hypothetical protein